MSRELKFRYYDPSINAMLNPDYIGEFGFYTNGRNLEDGKSEPLDRLMQFTGLRDKNGKEIYEGDIVDFVGGTTNALRCGNYAKDVHHIGAKLKVVYLKSGYTLQPLSFNTDTPNTVGNVDNYDFWNAHNSLEVMGNVHQNPELLKD